MDRLDQILKPPPRKKAEYTLDRICELVEPQDRDELILALGKLVRSGKIKMVIRVESPGTQGGIKDYGALDEVPRVITDWRTGLEMEVTPDNLRLVYVVPAQDDHA